MASSATITARELVEASHERVFAILRDLDRHRGLTDGGMQILSLDGPPGRRSGGWVELRGPAGLRRLARTQVHGAEAGRRLWGAATTAQGTEAELEWTLEPCGTATAVQVQMRLTARHWSDRLLLRIGARGWLRRRLRFALRCLGAPESEQGPAQASRSARLATSARNRSRNASTLS